MFHFRLRLYLRSLDITDYNVTMYLSPDWLVCISGVYVCLVSHVIGWLVCIYLSLSLLFGWFWLVCIYLNLSLLIGWLWLVCIYLSLSLLIGWLWMVCIYLSLVSHNIGWLVGVYLCLVSPDWLVGV